MKSVRYILPAVFAAFTVILFTFSIIGAQITPSEKIDRTVLPMREPLRL